jgi:hypothetical protein
MQGRVTPIGHVAVVVVLLASLAPTVATHPRLTQVTWTADIEPIIERRCRGCHVEGGFGPMPLTNYDEVRTWSRAISEEVMERRMPPWSAAPGFGDFGNDRSLTPIEVELLVAWTEGGTPVGPLVTRPVPRLDAGSNLLPDLELPLASGTADTPQVERYELPTGLTADKWITGWAFRPGDRALVESADLNIRTEGFVAAWVPPESAVMFPPGVARRVPAGATLVVDVHYRKSGAPRTGAGSVVLYFGARPRHELRHRTLGCGAIVLDEDIDVLAVRPRAGEAGARIEALARRPDETVEPLCAVQRFLPAYVPTYRFRAAVRLPRATTVDVRSTAAECALDVDYVPVR